MPRLPHPRTALSGFVDARLPRWRRALVRHHLRGCTRCAVEVAQVRALRDLLRDAPPGPEVPPHLLDRLLALGGETGGGEPGPVVPPVTAGLHEAHEGPRGVGAAGVLVASVLVLGAVVAGSAATGVPLPWPSATARASVGAVLPRLWSEAPEGTGTQDRTPGGAGSVQPVDNGQRP